MGGLDDNRIVQFCIWHCRILLSKYRIDGIISEKVGIKNFEIGRERYVK